MYDGINRLKKGHTAGNNLLTTEGAQATIDLVKNAINLVFYTRGDLGAMQNHLEHTINNLSVTTGKYCKDGIQYSGLNGSG